MRFFDIFSTQHGHLIIGFLLGAEIFEFLPKLCLWQPAVQQIFTDF